MDLGPLYKNLYHGGEGRIAEIRRMGREALEAGLGRGGYVVGAIWDEGNMVQAMRRFGGRTIQWRYGEPSGTRSGDFHTPDGAR